MTTGSGCSAPGLLALGLVAQLPGEGQDLQVDLVRQLWRVDAPFTEPVLQALASSAPQGLSKAARKALLSFRSAGKG